MPLSAVRFSRMSAASSELCRCSGDTKVSRRTGKNCRALKYHLKSHLTSSFGSAINPSSDIVKLEITFATQAPCAVRKKEYFSIEQKG